jgi:hypothetical protein
LAAVAAPPLAPFLVYMAAQQGLKSREDLHGSPRWAERKDIQQSRYKDILKRNPKATIPYLIETAGKGQRPFPAK